MRRSALCLLVVLGVVASAPARSQPVTRTSVVATVDGRLDVTVAELTERAPRLLYRGIVDPTRQYQTALQEAVLERLKGLDFFRRGYDRDAEFVDLHGLQITEELLVAYYERQYEQAYLNDESLRREHERMGRVVQVRQVILPKPNGATAQTLQRLRQTVGEIRRRLDEGVPVEDLVTRYSEDEASVRVGGLTEPITWEQSTQTALSAAAFELDPGEAVSLETGNAFIVAVGDRVGRVETPPFEAVRDRLVTVLRGRYADQANEAYYEERQGMVDSLSVRWNTDLLSEIVEWVDTPGFFEGGYVSVINDRLVAQGDTVVFRDSAGELRLSGLPRLIREVLVLSRRVNDDVELVQDYLLEAVRADRMADRARELGLDQGLLRPGSASPVLSDAFRLYYDERRIEDELPEPTESALRDFYEANDDSLFYQLETVYTEVIERETEAEIDHVWSRVQDGVPFSEASHRRLVRSFQRTRDGSVVTRNLREPPYVGEVALGLSAGETAGPLSYETPRGRRYAIVLVTKRLDERQLAFEEVRDRVAEAFTEHHRQRLAAEVEAELRDRYTVEVDDALWSRMLGALQ